MNSSDKLHEFNKLVSIDSAKARAIILQLPYSEDAYLLSCIALTYRDEAMFFKNGNPRKFFVSEKLLLAKKHIDQAYLLQKNCRDVLYNKGTIYNAIGDTNTAIDCYINIVENGDNADNEYNCSGGDKQFVKMLINDSYFQLYRLFHDLESFDISKRFLEEYKKELRKGINTIYTPLEKFLM